jgi:hypothetical protein
MYKTAGTNQSGTWTNDWTVPCTASVGKYRATVQLLDAAGNATAWSDLPNFWVTPSTAAPAPKITQTITFPVVANRYFNDSGSALLATATSGLAIMYSNSTPKICQILSLGAGKYSVQPIYPLTGSETVTCTIVAAQPGDAKYASAANVERSFTMSKQPSLINVKAPTNVSLNGDFIYGSVATSAGRAGGSLDTLGVAALTPLVCSVSDVFNTFDIGTRATLRARANGTCSIKYIFAGDTSLLGSEKIWSFNISGITAPAPGSATPQTITFPAIADREYGPAAPLAAKATSGLEITYTSLTPSVCYILFPTQGAVVQSVTPKPAADTALCTVQAKQLGDDRYSAAAPVTQSFNWRKAAMKVTLTGPTSMPAAGPYVFVASTLFVQTSMNSGLKSLGHLLTVTSNTPTICRVDSNALWDRTGGIVNRTQITALTNGACSLTWYFAGTADRATTSTTWTGTASGFPVATSTFIELQSLQKVIAAAGNIMSLKGLDGGRVIVNAFVKTPDPKLMGSSQLALNDSVSVTSLTPTICVVDGRTLNMGSTNPYTGVTIKPLAKGTCTIRFSYAGDAGMLRGASSVDWSATVG